MVQLKSSQLVRNFDRHSTIGHWNVTSQHCFDGEKTSLHTPSNFNKELRRVSGRDNAFKSFKNKKI